MTRLNPSAFSLRTDRITSAARQRRARERAQREASERTEREAKERLHRQMADYWMATGWPLEDA